jgi:hypothetical protein
VPSFGVNRSIAWNSEAGASVGASQKKKSGTPAGVAARFTGGLPAEVAGFQPVPASRSWYSTVTSTRSLELSASVKGTTTIPEDSPVGVTTFETAGASFPIAKGAESALLARFRVRTVNR